MQGMNDMGGGMGGDSEKEMLMRRIRELEMKLAGGQGSMSSMGSMGEESGPIPGQLPEHGMGKRGGMGGVGGMGGMEGGDEDIQFLLQALQEAEGMG